MNLFHHHDDNFEGTHTHDVNGSNLEHTHVYQSAGDGPVIEVVEALGGRYKQPKTAATGPHAVLDVHDSASEQQSESAG